MCISCRQVCSCMVWTSVPWSSAWTSAWSLCLCMVWTMYSVFLHGMDYIWCASAWHGPCLRPQVCFASCAEIDLDGLLSSQRSEGRVHPAPLLDSSPTSPPTSPSASPSASPTSSAASPTSAASQSAASQSAASRALENRRFERCWLPGWPGHNHYKLSLPTRCAALRALPCGGHAPPLPR